MLRLYGTFTRYSGGQCRIHCQNASLAPHGGAPRFVTPHPRPQQGYALKGDREANNGSEPTCPGWLKVSNAIGHFFHRLNVADRGRVVTASGAPFSLGKEENTRPQALKQRSFQD
jgi:hypothetical protein